MGCCKKLLLLSLLVTPVALGFVYQWLTHVPDLPKLELEKWWGPGNAKKADISIRPFKIQFTDEMVTDLRTRLSKAPSFTPLEGVGFEYGFNNNYLQKVLSFWAKDYNFKERETFLNKYPQFKTNIQGLDIHYIHVKPPAAKNVKVVPLLLLHGWPGSVREFYEAIPMLTTPRKDHDFVFEVIVPSLPGYGFSQGASKTGLGADQIAIVMRNLMHRLGHKKYYVQGGDWGSLITANMATFFPSEILMIHVNMANVMTPLANLYTFVGSFCPSLIMDVQYKDRMYPFTEKMMTMVEEMGYMHLQSTKPDTIGMVLRDSPAGLAAYILEKFSAWTNMDYRKLPDGGLTKKFKLVDLIDNLMMYWASDSITTSMRLYSETMNKRYFSQELDRIPATAPAAIANFKHELAYQPESILKLKFKNLVQVSHFEDGGHFAAFELPKLLTDDVWSAIAKAREAQNSQKNEL